MMTYTLKDHGFWEDAAKKIGECDYYEEFVDYMLTVDSNKILRYNKEQMSVALADSWEEFWSGKRG